MYYIWVSSGSRKFGFCLFGYDPICLITWVVTNISEGYTASVFRIDKRIDSFNVLGTTQNFIDKQSRRLNSSGNSHFLYIRSIPTSQQRRQNTWRVIIGDLQNVDYSEQSITAVTYDSRSKLFYGTDMLN